MWLCPTVEKELSVWLLLASSVFELLSAVIIPVVAVISGQKQDRLTSEGYGMTLPSQTGLF